ncbi:hypothetical protein TVAG_281720 [Trichomonas vaginalis G3]|uniref:Uncharacterized protein n=1 Tax=Trichomonas vaginalis (strain ATCC PRA-98 / G3) TaxID=412133 RepID=A2E9N7_TRIV3|nr:secreted protein-related family [Trichomonas vaginalis G3]EAY10572.1 hypothetical protein TVAG_281720 [Trichomonas vaginalis G3]KAI5540821.1 secreted protein-related family [Trichomonas vaginalis G3]|eukprot:XP_001322795.1 hypothetical protein [Trichomonas vaginalis G3]
MIVYIFYNIKYALLIGGGRDYIVRNNVFIKNTNAVRTDSRCANGKNPLMMKNHLTLSERYYKINGNPNVTGYLPPYSDRYENISKIDDYYKRRTVEYPLIPPSVIYSYNAFYNNTRKFLNPSNMNEVYFDNNIDADESDFADFANGDYSIKKGSRLNKLGFEPIDMNKIGLIKESGKGKIVAISIVAALFIIAVIAIIVGIIVSKCKSDEHSTVTKSVDA